MVGDRTDASTYVRSLSNLSSYALEWPINVWLVAE